MYTNQRFISAAGDPGLKKQFLFEIELEGNVYYLSTDDVKVKQGSSGTTKPYKGYIISMGDLTQGIRINKDGISTSVSNVSIKVVPETDIK